MADEPQNDLPLGRMALHGALAGVIFFALNRFGLGQSFEWSLVWAVVAAPSAAYVAYSQTRR